MVFSTYFKCPGLGLHLGTTKQKKAEKRNSQQQASSQPERSMRAETLLPTVASTWSQPGRRSYRQAPSPCPPEGVRKDVHLKKSSKEIHFLGRPTKQRPLSSPPSTCTTT